MSKRANPTTIGLFVLLGLALGVAGLVTFASGRWFRQTEEFIVYFDGSVRGLNTGSAVMVSGVRVGSVREVLIHWNQESGDAHMPVIIEVDDKLLHSKTDELYRLADPALLEELVDKGLRARLQAESLVTGLLYVDLSILSDPPPAVYHQVKPLYPEIPSAPNEIQLLMENLAHLDIRGLSEKLDTVLVTLNQNLGDLRMNEINQGLTNLLDSLNAVAQAPGLTNALANLDRTLEETRGLAKDLRQQVNPLADAAEQTLAQTRATLKEFRITVENLNALTGPDAPFSQDLVQALEQISHAARSLGDLAEYLSRNPNALLTGREPREPNP